MDDWIEQLADKIPVLGAAVDVAKLKAEAPLYVAAAGKINPSSMNETSVADFTDAVLKWWKAYIFALPEFSKAARIAFSMSANSASCERVFSLLENMFGEARDSSLADMLQASLMLRYNKRRVG